MKKIINKFSGIEYTVISGIFLIISFILMILKIDIIFNPAWVTVIISGSPILYAAFKKIYHQKQISSSLLITIAMIASILIGELFAAGEVAFIMAIGGILEDLTVDKAKKGLKNLIALAPCCGRKIITEGGNVIEKIIPANEIREGDILRILPGENIPVDGLIISGTTSINQSVITGESLPVDKTIGDEVFCATLNNFGSIDIKATKIGENSTLQKLINLVREAENKKAPTQRIVDIWSGWLVITSVFIAVITLMGVYFSGLGFNTAIHRAVTILVVFCPCALVLATPVSIVAAIGHATKKGIIIKSGEALEKMGKVDVITFDKTGTLTYGELKICDIKPFYNEYTSEDVLLYAASAELKSEHPLGKAIVAYAKDKNIKIIEPQEFTMTPGRGVCAIFSEDMVYCGNNEYLSENGVNIGDDIDKVIEELRNIGQAVILVGLNDKCIGVISLSDTVRPVSGDVISEFGALGIRAVLLTGDNKNTAEYIANKVGIKDIYAELLPEDKVKKIIDIQKAGGCVCMVGDGINDAPALKTSDVGVAMGAVGCDIAIDSADIALMNDNISKLPYLKRLSIDTVNLIKLNISLAMLINFVGIILSILGFLTPVTGALVHNAGSVLVILNATSLYNRKY